jgi:hypothetical protein
MFPSAVARELRERGHDLVAVVEVCRHEDRSHHGILLTSDHRFPRREPGTIGRLVSALDGFATVRGDLRDALEWLG